MPDILHTHPALHKKRAKEYFIPNMIKLQPEYQHIAISIGLCTSKVGVKGAYRQIIPFFDVALVSQLAVAQSGVVTAVVPGYFLTEEG